MVMAQTGIRLEVFRASKIYSNSSSSLAFWIASSSLSPSKTIELYTFEFCLALPLVFLPTEPVFSVGAIMENRLYLIALFISG